MTIRRQGRHDQPLDRRDLPATRDQTIDDQPVLVDRPVQVPPNPQQRGAVVQHNATLSEELGQIAAGEPEPAERRMRRHGPSRSAVELEPANLAEPGRSVNARTPVWTLAGFVLVNCPTSVRLQARIWAGRSSTAMNARIQRAASTPSTGRWSTLRVTVRTVPGTTAPSTTIASARAAPTARIED